MMLRYKLANKRLSTPTGNDGDGGGQCSRTISTTSDLRKSQPKRVSLSLADDTFDDDSTDESCSVDSMGFPILDSPIPTRRTIDISSVSKPTKTPKKSEFLQTDTCFTPIGGLSKIFDEATNWGILDTSESRAALISPRLTPDSTSYPAFDNQRTNRKAEIPDSLYIRDKDEEAKELAASVLLSIKNLTGVVDLSHVSSSCPRKRPCGEVSSIEDDLNESLDSSHVITPLREQSDPYPKRRKLYRSSRNGCKGPQREGLRGSSVEKISSLEPNERTAKLSMPDDAKNLNSLHCFVRSDLLEVFSTNEQRHKGSRSARVGFRCVHCGHLSRKEKEGASMSIFYPKSLKDIYRSVCTWQRIHFKCCKHVPSNLVEKYDYLKDIDRTRGKKQHWVSSAYRLGLRDFDNNRGGIIWDEEGEFGE